jgi:hypothetical protein
METKINLPRDGREYLYLTFSSLPSGVDLEFQVGDDAAPWYPIDTTGSVPKILLRGPAAADVGGAVPVLASGPMRYRIVAVPELIARPIGHVVLVS